MGWMTTTMVISIAVDTSGGERQERGERLRDEFVERLEALCDEYGWEGENRSAIAVMVAG